MPLPNARTGIPIPLAPRSPKPRMREPSVTTMTCTLSLGQLYTIEHIAPRSSDEKYMPGSSHARWRVA